ncbi:WD40-repeat-containing domain protein [Gymnopilus junonius]|uniref:WD40-repeat-containing domain protein n=1 Tax=Gymnopilus junonius TaxID=109634 RepID=A0A9P5NCV5_GYMJU|nr:WD40-repeat-containing domain protein [Gymnopilus junonius]
MYHQPKTPLRARARSEAKTPLTPSILNGMNNISLASSPTKRTSRPGAPIKSKASTSAFDTTNPFIVPQMSKSRPSSPVKRSGTGGIPNAESLQRQASGGVIRKGGVESRLDVVTRDYVPPRHEIKRSRSTPASRTAVGDRFITNREATDLAAVSATLELLSLNPQSSSPGHTARLAAATGMPINRRILGYHEQPPTASSSDTTLAQQREFARPLYSQRPGAIATSTGATTNKTRKIRTEPIRVLDAPSMMDDFYLNLLAWSSQNALAIGLENSTYVWKADTGTTACLGECQEGLYVTSLDFSRDGAFLGIGIHDGVVELWDAETGQKLRSMTGHQGQVASLSWNEHILTSGCIDGSIWCHDVRIGRHKVMELIGHTGEVCGLKWRPDGELLASGGNDNVVNIWDARLGNVGEGARGSAKWTKRNHTAAVKALGWCPWQPTLLATGGGTNDATVNIWNSTSGARLHTLRTPSQVTSINWSQHCKEIVTTHGYPTNSVMVHAYPSMERVAEIRDAHDSRVLHAALSPAGDVLATTSGDEMLKFWKIWEPKSSSEGAGSGQARKKKIIGDGELGGGRKNSTKEGILTLR